MTRKTRDEHGQEVLDEYHKENPVEPTTKETEAGGDPVLREKDYEFTESALFRLTAKGRFCAAFQQFGATDEQATEQWVDFEQWCIRRAERDGFVGGLPALIFDGGGGVCVSLNRGKGEPS